MKIIEKTNRVLILFYFLLNNRLDLVLKQEFMFIVLDNTKEMWKKNKLNLIHVRKYVYFDSRDKTIVLALF